MARRPATVTQADLARAIRAAKQAGAAEVEVRVGEQSRIIIRIKPSTGEKIAVEEIGQIIL
jgi:DNA-binding XRE family transcriptional regulator